MKQKNNNQVHKIDVIVKFFFPLKAGIETNVANVYGYLVENGWSVNLHTSKDMPDGKDVLPDSDLIKGVIVKRYSWNWYGFIPQIDWSKTEAICLHNFDIFPHSWILLYVGIRKILGFKNPKIFLTPHGGFTPGWETFPLWQRIIKKIYQRVLGVYLINSLVDGYRSVSSWEGGESIKNGVRSELVHIITNGLEDEAYLDVDKLASSEIKAKVKGYGKYLLQTGRIHPIKNQATAIKALFLLPKDIKLVLVGPVTDFEYKKSLDELIKINGLKDRVIFAGVVSGIDKYFILKHCLVYTHMALWESYCNTVHESMSQSCVCIISKDTALEELIQNNITGYAIPVFDYKAVAKKVEYVVDSKNKNEIDKIKERAKLYTSGHSWREISRNVGDMYNQSFNNND